MELVVKDTFKKQKIAFGKNPLPLGERSQKELHELALSALHPDGEVKDSFIAGMFEGDLDKEEIEGSLKTIKEGGFKKKAPVSDGSDKLLDESQKPNPKDVPNANTATSTKDDAATSKKKNS